MATFSLTARAQHGTALVNFDTASQTYVTTLFDGTFAPFINEGARFVETGAVTSDAYANGYLHANFDADGNSYVLRPLLPYSYRDSNTYRHSNACPGVATCATAVLLDHLDALASESSDVLGRPMVEENHLSGGVQRTPASFKGFAILNKPKSSDLWEYAGKLSGQCSPPPAHRPG